MSGLVLFFLLLCFNQIDGFCWKPNSTPFYGQPKVIRQGDRVRVDWSEVFNDGQDCVEVDFIIKVHPKNDLSAYTLSEYTLKGERKATLKLDPNIDYVIQIIAREDKGDVGIDYKYSDMVTSQSTNSLSSSAEADAFIASSIRTTTTTTTTTTISYLKPQTKSLLNPSLTAASFGEPLQYETIYDDIDEDNDPIEYGETPWYIYECVPFIKELTGYDENSGSQNKLLESFIKQMNTKPLDVVDEFITKDKVALEDQRCDTETKPKTSKGYLKQCSDGSQLCCSNLWSNSCSESDCYSDYTSCDGNRCIPSKWVQDGWPDCLDGSDESNPGNGNQSLPEQLVCIQCAGVVLSAGFVCRESRMGLTSECLQDVMGAKGACNNCVSYYFNLS